MNLKDVAQETLEIIKSGKLPTKLGASIDFAAEQANAVNGTRLYRPEQLQTLLQSAASEQSFKLVVEVTDETTQIAAQRLTQLDGINDVVLLNFASARNPGGGFINGAKAQEEDLSRCSGLYPCLLTQPTYYDENRKHDSYLYTDHIIYSPNVPFFRTASENLLDYLFFASIITAPAPNAGVFLSHQPENNLEVLDALKRRAGMVLSVARDNNHRNLILGAWGCGVFRNDPEQVADVFGDWLESSSFQGCFDRVVFAVYHTAKNKETFTAFQQRFTT